ncbi:MAG: glycerate kinase, partial [Erysipelotrichales bacterium]
MLKRILCIPDSFKGTLSSSQVIQTIKEEFKEFLPDTQIIGIEAADGGDGTVEAFLSTLGGQKMTAIVNGPRFKKMDAYYGITPDKVAIIEMCVCAGMDLVKGLADPRTTSTYGVGELMIAAWEQGCRKIIVGLGDSCTNDGGCGVAAALGIHFLDKEEKPFIPTGGTLIDIDKIDISEAHPLL